METKSNKSVVSLVFGIIGIVCWFFGYSSLLSVVFGIVGLILASSAKKDGDTSGIRTAGFVTSLISLIVGIIVFAACVACIGTIGFLAS